MNIFLEMHGTFKFVQHILLYIYDISSIIYRYFYVIRFKMLIYVNFYSSISSQYLVQSYCSATNMNTRSQAAHPPSQPAGERVFLLVAEQFD